MMEILASVVTGVLGGGATGLLGVLLQRFFEWKKQQNDLEIIRVNHANTLALRQLELSAQERIATRTAESEELIAHVEAQAREAEAAERSLQASYEADQARYVPKGQKLEKWTLRMMALVDFARGMIRPFSTVYLMVIVTLMWRWTTQLAAEYGITMSADQVLSIQMQLIGTLTYCAVTSLVWWFGSRPPAEKR